MYSSVKTCIKLYIILNYFLKKTIILMKREAKNLNVNYQLARG